MRPRRTRLPRAVFPCLNVSNGAVTMRRARRGSGGRTRAASAARRGIVKKTTSRMSAGASAWKGLAEILIDSSREESSEEQIVLTIE